MRIIRPGDTGEAVRDVQRRLLALGVVVDPSELDGHYGLSTEAAVRTFQQRRGLPADGLVGPDTWGQLVEVGYRFGDRALYLRAPMFRGDDVRELQRRLNALGFDAGKEDGIFGPRTADALVEFQRNTGAPPDGIVGPDTVTSLTRLRSAVAGPSRALVREAEAIRHLHRAIAGTTVAIDPGHGRDDPGGVGETGLLEADATMLLAADVAEALERLGARSAILRTSDQSPSPSDRARAANQTGADLCISLHLNAGERGAEGATCFYFGNETTYSPAGQLLAELVQDELVTRLGLKDGRTHRLQVAVLRETRMPAVQVEPCFITNEREEALLKDPDRRRDIAAAIAVGVERFFSSASETATAQDDGAA